MKLFDSHCHMDDRSFAKDGHAALDPAKEAGVSEMMIVGTNTISKFCSRFSNLSNAILPFANSDNSFALLLPFISDLSICNICARNFVYTI